MVATLSTSSIVDTWGWLGVNIFCHGKICEFGLAGATLCLLAVTLGAASFRADDPVVEPYQLPSSAAISSVAAEYIATQRGSALTDLVKNLLRSTSGILSLASTRGVPSGEHAGTAGIRN